MPQRAVADQQDGDENQHHIPRADADGVGVYDEAAGGVAQRDEAVGLLQVAEDEAEDDAGQGPEAGDEAAFKEEDADDLAVLRTKVA